MHGAEEVRAALAALDAELGTRCDIVIVGGSAITLLAPSTHATPDIDTTDRNFRELVAAASRAVGKGTLHIPVQCVGGNLVAPDDYEDRLQEVAIEGLTRLRVFVPEPHDLAIMKIGRGQSHDLQGIADLAKVHPLDETTLLGRFRNTMYIGNPRDFELSYCAMIGRLFGREAEQRAWETFGIR